MDVVVLLWRVHPVLFEIVDKEVNVFRHEVWLDWRKIDPGDLSIGVFVADCNKTGMLVSRGSLSAPSLSSSPFRESICNGPFLATHKQQETNGVLQ